MRTTVVIASRNGGTRLLGTLRRLEALPGRGPVIVIDSGSDDGTPALVAVAHPAVVLIRVNTDLGPRVRNLGAARARTPYVAFLDDDAWPDAALAHAVGILDANSDVGLVTGLVGGRADGRRTRLLVARCAAFAAVGGFRRRRLARDHGARLARDMAAAGWRAVSLDGGTASGQVRPQLQVVPAVGPDLRPAQDALEHEARLRQRTLLGDVRDVG